MRQKERVALLESSFRYKFRDENLCLQAATHSSLKTARNKGNEVLEFLGDAVLLSIITDIIVRENPTLDEGALSKMRSQIITNQNLAQTVELMGATKALKMARGQKSNPNILSDFFEAMIGAIYFDGGTQSVFFSVKKIYDSYWKELSFKNTDFKSQLQEYTQKRLKVNPEYRVVETEGRPHELTFTVAVVLNNEIMALGKGKNKKQAEQMGARQALEKLKKSVSK